MNEVQDNINFHMSNIVTYFKDNAIVINSDKTKMITLSLSKKRQVGLFFI